MARATSRATDRTETRPAETIMSNSDRKADPKLLEILVCPLTKGPLRYDAAAQELISDRAGLAYRGSTVAFGEYGLMAMERCWLDTKQIEAARVAIARNMKRHGKLWIRIFPQKSYTKKPLETRMGKGKGPLESWVAVIRPANVLFEVDGVTEAIARESLRLAATKLPIKTKFISRHRLAAA